MFENRHRIAALLALVLVAAVAGPAAARAAEVQLRPSAVAYAGAKRPVVGTAPRPAQPKPAPTPAAKPTPTPAPAPGATPFIMSPTSFWNVRLPANVAVDGSATAAAQADLPTEITSGYKAYINTTTYSSPITV